MAIAVAVLTVVVFEVGALTTRFGLFKAFVELWNMPRHK